MKSINVQELKAIQLDMLKELHTFCVKNNIKYSLAYGSLIGAIRHNGYIPWDDDIDVVMTRPEYNKFRNLFKHKYIEFSDTSTNKNHMLSFGKLYDKRTILIEDTAIQMKTSVYLDVFVVDGLGNNYFCANAFFRFMVFINNLRTFKMVKINASRSYLKNIILILGKTLLLPFTYKRLLKYSVRGKTNFEFSRSKYVANLCSTKCYPLMTKTLFDNYVLHRFENIDVYILKDYDQYLKIYFDDYMQLPPKENRISHHAFEAFWDE